MKRLHINRNKIILILFVTSEFVSCNTRDEFKSYLFESVSPGHSGVKFINELQESEDFNIIEYLYYYNGGGVAIGDINNDGLDDLYFSSNQKSNRLYLNKGNFTFEDITEKSHVTGSGNWKTGVAMADVNGDGLLDIFSCGVGSYKNFNGRNTLYINNGDLTFSDRTTEYGLDFQGFSTQSVFFDYDNDGDLDMYLVNHSVHTRRTYGHSSLRYESDPFAGDKLYRNDMIPNGKVYFTEVTSRAGIYSSQIGYGLSAAVSDVNNDGYLDIYVCNDFNENDYLYVNKGDGTFDQRLEKSIPHTSRFSMGSDAADINNDGLTDILTVDMLPWKEEVLKTTAGEDSYDIYEFKLKYGYHYQFSRNALQLNRGFDGLGNVAFSDIAPISGVAATDWSWAPLFADFDNDGNKDLFVTNGIKGRPNDLDYINYIQQDSAQRFYTEKRLADQMPSGAVPNQIFRNNGKLAFENKTGTWMVEKNSFSNGAAYADLDNDGDLDIVVNNLNSEATLYRNNLKSTAGNYLTMILKGDRANLFGVGARVNVYAGGKNITHEQLISRGWLSSISPRMHIGIGSVSKIDSVIVQWPGSRCDVFTDVPLNSTFTVRPSEAASDECKEVDTAERWFTKDNGPAFKHRENDYVAFNDERLIPVMLSTEGPAFATGDINGDKLDDIFIGGAHDQAAAVFLQHANGSFMRMSQPAIDADSSGESVDAEFFDANGDGADDVVVVNGGQESRQGYEQITAKLYMNDGHGKFKSRPFPKLGVQASCVKTADIDDDGDIDLFIGGQVIAGQYGFNPPSFILMNDGSGNFEDKTDTWFSKAFPKHDPGMVSDAAWADLNGDKRVDLILAGQWMPITILLQDGSDSFVNATAQFGLDHSHGWWNAIEAEDMDNDGDVDLIAGNLGLNSRLQATETTPVTLYVGDIDRNNSLDHLLVYNNGGAPHPFASRDQLVRQVPSMKKKFIRYESFREVSVQDILTPEQKRDFLKKDVYTFASTYFENKGNTHFSGKPMDLEVQLFPTYGICISDVNRDGNKDIVTAGNLDAVQPDLGRLDAGYGMVLTGDGKGNFTPVEPATSGLIIRGQARKITELFGKGGSSRFLIAINNDSVLVYDRNIKASIERMK